MIARNFILVCTIVVVFAIVFFNLVNNRHRYGEVTRFDERFRLH